jgi:hypothetical protein
MGKDNLIKYQLVNDNGGKGYAIVADTEGNEVLMPLGGPNALPRGQVGERRKVNLGNQVTLVPIGGPGTSVPGSGPSSQPLGILRYQSEECKAFQITCSGTQVPINPGVAMGQVGRPVMIVDWGVGGVSFREVVDVSPPRGRFTCVAQSVQVTVQLLGITGLPFSTNVQCIFNAQLEEGIDPDFRTPTQFINNKPSSTSQIVSTAPCRLVSITAYDQNGAGADTLMLFDAVANPGNGASPDLAFPIPAFPGIVNADFERSEFVFLNGLFWAVSSTPYILTLGGNAIRVDTELLR